MTDNGEWGVFLILWMLILLAFGLRLYRLEVKSLWQDSGVGGLGG